MKNPQIRITYLLIGIFIIHCISRYGKNISISIEPDHTDWIECEFQSLNHWKYSRNTTVSYEIGPEKMSPWKRESFNANDKEFTINGGTLNNPGFLRCTIIIIHNNSVITDYATAAFQPEGIIPITPYPNDFLDFWKSTIAEARKIPLETQYTLLKEKCTDEYNVYQVSYLNNEYKNRSCGIITIPTKDGKYPAIIKFPGADVHPPGGISLLQVKVLLLLTYISIRSRCYGKAIFMII